MSNDALHGDLITALPPTALRPPHARSTLLDWGHGFALHILTGVASVAAHYSLMWVLLQLGASALAASGTGFAAGATVRYLVSHFKVFAPSGSLSATMIKFVAALGAQMAVNLVLLEVLMGLGLDLWVSQMSTTVFVTFINYLIYRLWVFK